MHQVVSTVYKTNHLAAVASARRRRSATISPASVADRTETVASVVVEEVAAAEGVAEVVAASAGPTAVSVAARITSTPILNGTYN